MLQIFNCPHCQGVFKAECDEAVSHVECPHCVSAVDVSALPASDPETHSKQQESAEPTEPSDAADKGDAEAVSAKSTDDKPKMKVSEAEVKRSLLPPGFNKQSNPEVVDPPALSQDSMISTDGEGDDHNDDEEVDEIEPDLAIPKQVVPEADSESDTISESSGLADAESKSESVSQNETSDALESDDLVLPSLLENAETLPSANQMLGSLADRESSQSPSVGIHVIDTNEEEEALIERVIEDRRQFKRKKNVVLWFFGFVIIALTLLVLIK